MLANANAAAVALIARTVVDAVHILRMIVFPFVAFACLPGGAALRGAVQALLHLRSPASGDNPGSGHFIREREDRIVDQLAEMRVFVRAIERGAFAAAAKDLGLTPSAVSKLITRLEARLGVRLVNRTTRRLSLTPEGEVYFSTGRRLIGAFDGLEADVSASADRPRGLIRVNTNFSFGVSQLAPALPDFSARHPEVQVDLAITDRVVDLNVEQVDVAIRTGAPHDSSLMARRIADTRRVICASPRYIERFGAPSTPAELASHMCIIFRGTQNSDRWPFKTTTGTVERVVVPWTVTTDSAACVLALALEGAGIVRIGELLIGDPIRRGVLVPIAVAGHDPEPWPVYAMFPPGTQKIPRVRAFLDFLIERFGGAPWRLSL